MSRQAPRPKRSADVYTRTHFQSNEDDDGPTTKKPRFDYRNPSTLAPDAPEDDEVLDLDEIGKGGGVKRNAVNIDGYESDSDNDNFDARARRKVAEENARKKAEQDDEDDMFGDLEEPDGDDDDDELKRAGKGKKDVRFLDVDEIEGQVASSKSGGHVSADFSLGSGVRSMANKKTTESSSESGSDSERDRLDSDVDEEVGAGGKKKHAPKLDAFNMRAENEEGAFDETGNFVRKAVDPDSVHDNWLEGVSKKDMKKAKEAQQQREEERKQKDRADDALLTEDLLGTLIGNLQIGETVLEALQRLGKGKPKSKPKPKWQKKSQKGNANGDSMDVDNPAEDAAETKRKEAVEAITGAADQLMTRGDLEIYDREREILMRMYKRETGEDWVGERPAEEDTNKSSSDDQMWEYRWADGRDGGQHHGPYDNATMKAWNEAGYFGEGFECRVVGEDEWSRLADF